MQMTFDNCSEHNDGGSPPVVVTCETLRQKLHDSHESVFTDHDYIAVLY